jgi:hypothetical protein
MSSKICVPIDSGMYAEFILRSGKNIDVASYISNIVRDYLDRTDGDAGIWSEDHAEKFHAQLGEDFEKNYGDPEGFFQWDNLFLENGTQIRMKYKGRNYIAAVRDEQIVFEGKAYTPSQLASKIANGTSRNAWKDLWIKERGAPKWVLAHDHRRFAKAVLPAKLEDF